MISRYSAFTPAALWLAIKRLWWIVIIAVVVGAAGAFLLSSRAVPIFQSTASLYVSIDRGGSASDLNQGSAYTQNQMLSFAQLATSAIVLDPVIEKLELDESRAQLRQRMSVSIPQNTVILDITVADTDPDQAALVANALSTELATAVEDLAPSDADGKSTVVAQTIEPATAAIFQTSPNKQRDAMLGAFIGLLAGLVIIIVWSALDTRVRNEEELARVTSLPLVGAIERAPATKDSRPVVLREPRSRGAESFRRVRASLQYVAVNRPLKTLMVTSSRPGEGKTTVATNLAFALAESHSRVLLIDADLRRPRVADALQLEGAVGLTTVLVGRADAEDVVQQWGDTSLYVLPAGESPPNPAEVLSSPAMGRLIDELSGKFDIVIIDTPPVLSVADATHLVQHTDAVLLVVDSSQVRRAQLAQTIDALELVGARVAGVVLNRLRAPRGSRMDYYTAPSP